MTALDFYPESLPMNAKNRRRLRILLVLLAALAVTLLFRWRQAERLRAESAAPDPKQSEIQTAPLPAAEPTVPDVTAEPVTEAPTEPEPSPTPEPVHYSIDEAALAAPAPDPACYGESDDPAVLAALLETERAKALIGEESVVWTPDTPLFPESVLRWYLDDTILVIVWQEVEAQAVGTFSEVFIADGSQLRRKICGDELFNFEFETTTAFARDTNAVLAFGGDFYHHARACGVEKVETIY